MTDERLLTPDAAAGRRRPAALRGAAGLAALATLLCASLLAPAGARAQAAAAAAPKEETVDSVLTAAGTLTIVRAAPEDGLSLDLRLDGKKVSDVDGAMSAGFMAHFRGLSSGEVILMRVSDGGSGCPAQFRLIRVVEEARLSMTEEFGDCSDSPNVTLELLPEERLLLRFPGYYRLIDREQPGFRKPPPTTWVYRKGVLSELKSAGKRRG